MADPWRTAVERCLRYLCREAERLGDDALTASLRAALQVIRRSQPL
ncbi:hypothetical protein [Novispirillum itersonii]|nr:hypothetical protein [Novispirillum itersonii]